MIARVAPDARPGSGESRRPHRRPRSDASGRRVRGSPASSSRARARDCDEWRESRRPRPALGRRRCAAGACLSAPTRAGCAPAKPHGSRIATGRRRSAGARWHAEAAGRASAQTRGKGGGRSQHDDGEVVGEPRVARVTLDRPHQRGGELGRRGVGATRRARARSPPRRRARPSGFSASVMPSLYSTSRSPGASDLIGGVDRSSRSNMPSATAGGGAAARNGRPRGGGGADSAPR